MGTSLLFLGYIVVYMYVHLSVFLYFLRVLCNLSTINLKYACIPINCTAPGNGGPIPNYNAICDEMSDKWALLSKI